MRGAYYNDNDPYCCEWLRNLIKAGHIAPGDVDCRDIRDVKAEDLRGYSQVHFFAGLGGWSYALRLAQWSDDEPVWTGSCPCQPFSAAGRRRGTDDPRHLWPEFRRLIDKCEPSVVFGEQVASAAVWLESVLIDLEALGFACGAANMPAACVGSPQIRQRFYFVAHADSAGFQRVYEARRGKHLQSTAPHVWRSWESEPGLARVADGLPRRVVADRIKGFGNAIVPQVAAEFIAAYREARAN